jgi:hypothetical protein
LVNNINSRTGFRQEFKDKHMEWINSVKPAVDARIVSDLSEDGDSDIDGCQNVRKEARSALSGLLKVLGHQFQNELLFIS